MTQENPPINAEEVESFDGLTPSYKKRLEAKENDITELANEEKRPITEKEKEQIENLQAQITYETSVNRNIESIVAKKPKGDEIWEIPKSETSHNVQNNSALRRLRTAFMGLFALGAVSSSAATKAPENTKEKNINPSVRTIEDQGSVKNENDSTIAVYTKAKTEKGGITPTGLNNSFLENEYNITQADIDSIANEYGFSKKDEVAFQKDMIEYAQKNDPEMIQYVLNHFGQTAYGIKNNMAPDDYKQLLDGLLGVRGAYITNFYKNKEVPNDKEKEVDPYVNFAQRGEVILSQGAGGHAVGQLFYKTRETSDVKDAGNTETSKVKSIFRHMNEDGHFTGAVTELTPDEEKEIFQGTRHVQNPDLLSKIEKKIDKN